MNTKATIQMSLLPLSVPLVERETSFSFMSRLAARNGVSTRLLGLDYDIPFKSVLDGESSVINYLNALGGVAPQQLLRWTASRSGGSYHILCDETFHGITIRNPTIKGCPVCLREDTHDPRRPPEQQIAILGHWMVKHVFLGQKHGHPLVKLWHETDLFNRYDTSPYFAYHAGAILQGDFDQETRECTDYDEWIDNQLGNGLGDRWLDQHPLHAAATFCFILGNALLRLEL